MSRQNLPRHRSITTKRNRRWGAWEQEQEHLRQQEEQFRGYSEELEGELGQAREDLGRSAVARQSAAAVLEEFGGEKESLLRQREDLVSALQGVRSKDTEGRERIHDLSLELESCRSSLQATQAVLERTQKQAAQLQERHETLQASVDESDAPLEELDAQLKELLEQRVGIEHSQAEARSVMQKTEEQMHARRERVVILQGKEQSLQNELSDARLAWQEGQCPLHDPGRAVG